MTPKPAARITDPHECEKIDQVPTPGTTTTGCIFKKTEPTTVLVPNQHKGAPVMPAGSPNVKIEGKPAARCGDLVGCVGVPVVDVIVSGAAHIKINGRLAAMKGSRCSHPGTITAGAAHVVYGDELEGATFGDSTAATEACKAAAKRRKDNDAAYRDWTMRAEYEAYLKKHPGATIEEYCKATGDAPPQPPPHGWSERQSYQNSCGHETARQLCIQKCRQGHQPACDACKKSEEEWYTDYMKRKIASHNQENKDVADAIRRENQAKWEKILAFKKAHPEHDISHKVGDKAPSHFDPTGQSWEKYEGERLWMGDFGKGESVRIVPVPKDKEPSFDEDQKLNGDPFVGSHDKTRREMLKEWCGIDPGQGTNETADITSHVAGGSAVVATVDIGSLQGGAASNERHVVTVTSMKYKADGTLDTVTMNDTAAKDGCGKVYPGAIFNGALVANENDGKPLPTIVVK